MDRVNGCIPLLIPSIIVDWLVFLSRNCWKTGVHNRPSQPVLSSEKWQRRSSCTPLNNLDARKSTGITFHSGVELSPSSFGEITLPWKGGNSHPRAYNSLLHIGTSVSIEITTMMHTGYQSLFTDTAKDYRSSRATVTDMRRTPTFTIVLWLASALMRPTFLGPFAWITFSSGRFPFPGMLSVFVGFSETRKTKISKNN